jgi:hypothetical protein
LWPLGAAAIALLPQFGLQIVVELMIGVAVTVFPPATASFALGLVEENAISQRVARNETFTHAGNVVFAVVAGVADTLIALASIFYGAAALALGMAGSVWFINGVSDEAARRGGGGSVQHFECRDTAPRWPDLEQGSERKELGLGNRAGGCSG